MDLFTINNGKVIPSVHALMTEPYKTMWAKDTSDDKAEVINVFSYIELLCSPKKSNPFFGYADEIKPKKIKNNIWGDENYQSDLYSSFEIIRGVEAYKEYLIRSAPGYELFLAGLKAADTLKDYLNSLDLGERTNSGGMVIKPADVTKALNDIPETIKGLKEGRDRVIADIDEAAKSRNNREINPFER